MRYIGWQGAAQLGEHVIEVHGGLLLRRGVRRCLNGGTRAQAGHLAKARSECTENPPRGLTGQARVTRLPRTTDDRTRRW